MLPGTLTKIWLKRHKRFIRPVFIIIMIIGGGTFYEIFLQQIIPDGTARLIFSRSLFIFVVSLLALTVIVRYQQTLSTLKNYFLVKSHPVNLAFFRIVLFGYLISLSQIPYQNTLWYSRLPEELIVAPHGTKWVVGYLPLPEGIVILLISLYYFFCFTALIGLYARVSAFFVAILGIYVIGFPGFFGFMNHYHHLIWFSFLLAFSRCSDFLSCDAVLAAWKRADQGEGSSPKEAICYALPLRFIWILIGMIYFFPGFWKIWISGLDWAFSGNLNYLSQFLVYNRVPILRLDEFPFIYRYGGLLTIIFELSFIFLIFSNSYRYVAVTAGLIFHTIVNLSLRITFLKLYICYVVFFDWNNIFQYIGRKIFEKNGYVIYNDNNKMYRRIIAALQVLDIFKRLTFVKSQDKQSMNKYGLRHPQDQYSQQGIYYLLNNHHNYGFSACRKLSIRIPVLWVILPFLYVWPVSSIANYICKSFTCKVETQTSKLTNSIPKKSQPLYSNIAVISVFIALFMEVIFYGSAKITQGWPFACYPDFALSRSEFMDNRKFEIIMINSEGQRIIVPQKDIVQKYHITNI